MSRLPPEESLRSRLATARMDEDSATSENLGQEQDVARPHEVSHLVRAKGRAMGRVEAQLAEAMTEPVEEGIPRPAVEEARESRGRNRSRRPSPEGLKGIGRPIEKAPGPTGRH